MASVGKPIKVPTPIYDRIEERAEREDISRGAVVRELVEKGEKYEQMEDAADA